MTLLVQPRLVNEPFSDAGIYLDFRFAKRAILFDIGDLAGLSSREMLRVSHVLVSHMHMDHFAGFDRLLRLCLYRDIRIHVIGPPGISDAVNAKLQAYTWNLLDEDSHDFSVMASDWNGSTFERCSLFRARSAFARRDVEPPASEKDLVLDDPEFSVETAMLDHGIPCLAFAFQEKIRVNVHKSRLDDLGLPVGPWLTEAKRSVRRGDGLETVLTPTADRHISLGDLLTAGALRTAAGQRIVYATDFAWHEANVMRLVDLARGADQLFIEAGFLDEDRALAASKKHLTAAQAGHVAKAAEVRHVVPMHFSPRYLHRESELRDEFEHGLCDRPDPVSRHPAI